MPIARGINGSGAVAAGTVATCSLSGLFTLGSCVLVSITLQDPTKAVTTFADDTAGGSMVFTFVGAVNVAGARQELWRTARNGGHAGGSFLNVTVSGATNVAVTLQEFTGVISIGNAISTNNNTANPSIALAIQDSNNWVVGTFGTVGSTAPTGLTGTLDKTFPSGGGSQVRSTIADNTSGGVGSVTVAVTLGATVWAGVALELRTKALGLLNTWLQQLFYQEAPDALWRLDEGPSYPATVMNDGATYYWRLGDLAGIASDATGNGNAAAPTNIAYGQPGAIADGDGAAGFNGINAYFDAGNLAPLGAGPFTLEFWARCPGPNALHTSQYVFWKSDGTHGWYVQFDQSGRFVFDGASSGGFHITLTSAGTYFDNVLRHFTFTWDGTTGANGMKLYVGGVVTDQATAGSAITIGTVANPLFLGASTGPANFFYGALDEVAIYQGLLLSGLTIAAHVARSSATQGLRVADLSPNSYDGTLAGGGVFAQAGYPGDGNKALQLTSGYVDVGNVAALTYASRFTVVAAFKTTATGSVNTIVAKRGVGGVAGWQLYTDASGRVLFEVTSAGGGAIAALQSSTGFNDGVYHLAIGVYNPLNRTAQVYLDGVLVASVTGLTPAPFASSLKLMIGARDNGSGVGTDKFVGTIDEVALYPYCWRAAQIAALIASRNKLTNDKALKQARSGVLRSGAGRSNYFNSRQVILLNGVDVTRYVAQASTRVTQLQGDQPSTGSLTFQINPTASPQVVPRVGNPIILADGAANNRYFRGRVTQRRRLSVPSPNGIEAYHKWSLTLTDGRYDLNALTVNVKYGVGTDRTAVVQDLVARSEGGFSVRHVQTGSGVLEADYAFKGVKIGDAIGQVARSVTPRPWQWWVDEYYDIHYCLLESAGRPKALIPGCATYENLDFSQSIEQIRTRVIGEGGGGKVTTSVAIGDTSIAVDDTKFYSAAIGTRPAVLDTWGTVITYTGVSAASGPGNLTGIPASGLGSVTIPILVNDPVHVWIVEDDAAAQAALAGLKGGSHNTGVHEHYVNVSDGTAAQVYSAVLAELASYKTMLIDGTCDSRDAAMTAGSILTINLPSSDINVDVTIQQVERTQRAIGYVNRRVTFATVWRNFVDVMKRARQTGVTR